MINISSAKTFPAGLDESWDMLCDVKNYPRFVPFISDVAVSGPLAPGMVWYDTTTLLWVKQRVTHSVEHIDPKKRLVFVLPVTGGSVTEDFRLAEKEGKTHIVLTVSISLNPPIAEMIVGRLLAARWRTMLAKTLSNLEEHLRKTK